MSNPDPTRKERLARLARKAKAINLRATVHADIRVIDYEAEQLSFSNSHCQTPLEVVDFLEWYCPDCKCHMKLNYREKEGTA